MRFVAKLPLRPAAHIKIEEPEVNSLERLAKGVSYRLGACGVPISRPEYFNRREKIGEFLVEHAVKVRHTLDQIAQIGMDTIDILVMNSINLLEEPSTRGMSAFSVIAWYTFFNPFAHPDRKHFFKRDFLEPVLMQNPDAYYKWAVFVHQKPDVAIYDKMLKMNPELAKHYFEFCANMLILKREKIEVSWLTNW